MSYGAMFTNILITKKKTATREGY